MYKKTEILKKIFERIPEDIENIIRKNINGLKYNDTIKEMIINNVECDKCLKFNFLSKKMCIDCEKMICGNCDSFKNKCNSCINDDLLMIILEERFGPIIIKENSKYLDFIISFLEDKHKSSLYYDLENNTYTRFPDMKEDIFVSYFTEI